MKRRIITYFILIVLEIFTSFYFTLFPIRQAIDNIDPEISSTQHIQTLYWFMRIAIVFINLVIVYQLDKRLYIASRILLGLISGIIILTLPFIIDETFTPNSITTGIISIALNYFLQIIFLELAIRYISFKTSSK